MKHIVILGAGFGGLRAAMLIGKDLRRLTLTNQYHLTVIDKNRYQTYTPPETASLHRLHDVVLHDIPTVLRGLPVHWVQDEVTALDVQHGRVDLSSGGSVAADYLVLALGAVPNYFNIPGLEENALTLKSFGDALAIRNTVLNLAKQGHTHLSVMIGGAGPTGVELSGELKAWAGELKQELRGCTIDITLLEASPTILPGFPRAIVNKASKRLAAIGVVVRTNSPIKSVGATSLSLQDGTVASFDVLVWTGGVKAPALLSRGSLKNEARGRIEVQNAMECLPQTPDLNLAPMIYGLGDSICFYNTKTGTPIPGVARAALMQANVVAHNVIADIKKETGRTKTAERITYTPGDYPYILPIGGKYAIAKFGPIVIAGFFGWVLKGAVELNYLLSIMPFSRALKVWLHGLRIFIKNDRLG